MVKKCGNDATNVVKLCWNDPAVWLLAALRFLNQSHNNRNRWLMSQMQEGALRCLHLFFWPSCLWSCTLSFAPPPIVLTSIWPLLMIIWAAVKHLTASDSCRRTRRPPHADTLCPSLPLSLSHTHTSWAPAHTQPEKLFIPQRLFKLTVALSMMDSAMDTDAEVHQVMEGNLIMLVCGL